MEPDSRYIQADLSGDGVYISSAYADKFRIKEGDTITLKEKYEKDEYSFKVDGIYDYAASLCVFMERDKLNEAFDLGDDYFGGYFSDTEIRDIPSNISALSLIWRLLQKYPGSWMSPWEI